MNALRLILKPAAHGWSVCLTDGRELARFRGPGSKWRALRYLARATKALQTPTVARKGDSPPTGATCWPANVPRRWGLAPGRGSPAWPRQTGCESRGA